MYVQRIVIIADIDAEKTEEACFFFRIKKRKLETA